MARSFTHRRRVEFSDTDMAGIVHFAQFFRYMEAAEHAWFRSMGLSIMTEVDGRRYGWPRVHAACDNLAPLRFEDEFDIRLTVREVRNRSLVLDFDFDRLPDGRGEPATVARGSLVTVCVRYEPDGTMKATTIPPEILEKLRE